MASPAVLTLDAIACVSAQPLVALLALLRGEAELVALLPQLLSLAVGGLLSAAFFHLHIDR